MRATHLTDELWNAIYDVAKRSASPREVYFVKVVNVDTAKQIIFAAEYGSMGIPLVAHHWTFDYYDTTDDGTVAKKTGTTKIQLPKQGDTVVIIDPWGARRFPFCIGVVQSRAGFWKEDQD